MKKTVFAFVALLTASICILMLAAPVFAADFKSLSIPGYTIKAPDGMTLPDRSPLVLAEKRVNPLDDRITMYLYRNPAKIYIDERGEFIYPYMEITIDVGAKTLHLLTVSFINAALEIELYENKAAFGDSHSDELMRVKHFKPVKIRQFDR